ncbi:hypothetical protein AV654_19535 [Paenibacillus elgii]|uniref:M23ase beta-sheet core domain-containing protein n=1 Tax=Paenibacillus elgii TaxID=189691 RepID=A0A163XNA5_9BACL|nr:M23 family metallopeptidase [Paenibacillus elgii]KZE78170.1 hypothetical protein AV654_19535 [Paenibacillus elgii]
MQSALKNKKVLSAVVILFLVCAFSPLLIVSMLSVNGLAALQGDPDDSEMKDGLDFLNYYLVSAQKESIDVVNLLIYDTYRTNNFMDEDKKISKRTIEKSARDFIYETEESSTCTDSEGKSYECTSTSRNVYSLEHMLSTIPMPEGDNTRDIEDLRTYYNGFLIALKESDRYNGGGSPGGGSGGSGLFPPSSWRPVEKEYKWPADGYYTITSPMGTRVNPVTGAPEEFHAGTDIATPIGVPVHAPRDGVITFADYTDTGGNIVSIDYQDGYTTRFLHLSKIQVKVGDKVTKGTVVALSGNTGRLTTGAHLHYEIRKNNIPLDPLSFYLP